MAVTKIHPIKSTLKKALDYIENPDKTEDKMLVSSFGCSYETADIEFEMLLAQAIQKGNNLAHHLIQSFAPGEATPVQAHEIGKQLADEVLQGKYSYVLTTHIDKGHVHNHLIFCAVDMVNHRKYNSNRQSYAYIRRTSDRLCREHGLSVVQPSRDKGKSYAEWDAGRKGKSWKAKLKAAIDAVIPQAKNFDDFLRLMAAQGYEIKQGKFISFRAPGQERFRCLSASCFRRIRTAQSGQYLARLDFGVNAAPHTAHRFTLSRLWMISAYSAPSSGRTAARNHRHSSE